MLASHPSSATITRSSYWTVYTPADATKILADCAFEHQRPVRLRHVDYLSRLMVSDDFQGSEIKFAQIPDGRRFLINGQHRLHAIVRSQLPQTMLCTVVLATDLEQVAVLYAAEDRGLGRNVGDTYTALGLFENLNLHRTLVGRGAAAVAIIAAGFDTSRYASHRITDVQRARMLEDWAPYLREWQDIVGSPSSSEGQMGRINNAGVLSIGIVTLRYQGQMATPFWRAVRANDGLGKGSSERAMADYITLRMGKRPGSASFVAKYVASVWNRHFRGRGSSIARPERSDGPIRIMGTPYDGEHFVFADE